MLFTQATKTLKMTATNPSPFANPFTQHRPYAGSPAITHTHDAKNLHVPDTTPCTGSIGASRLTVPNQDVPCSSAPACGHGFIGSTSLFKLMDGSIVDFKTGKIVLDPNKKFRDAGYWNDPNACTAQAAGLGTWGKSDTIESLMSKIGDDGRVEDPNLSPESIAYWSRARAEAEKCINSMTDEQKQLLDDLDAGKILRLSRLVEET